MGKYINYDLFIAPPPEPAVDMSIVESLTEMAFPAAAYKRAATLTHGKGLEAATQWIMENMDDPDFLSPLGDYQLLYLVSVFYSMVTSFL